MPLPTDEAQPLYSTELGLMFHDSCESALARHPLTELQGRVHLLFTSPPFPLNTKKRYGNRTGDDYLRWLASLAPLLSSLLRPDGSLVIEIGNAWEAGRPIMSTLPHRALLSFQEASGLHLCQEFIAFNPARLPSPVQWVNVERIRVKDAFTRVWWLSPTDRPKADNRKILTAYSKSMQKLLSRGTYNPGKRPSAHDIGTTSFLSDNGGAVPPNVLVPSAADVLEEDALSEEDVISNLIPVSNTSSQDSYLEHCRTEGIDPHPARMPVKLVEFFVEFLTDPGDIIVDPFAGSNTTGAVSERLGRKWISVEADAEFASTSSARFPSVETSDRQHESFEKIFAIDLSAG